MERSILLFFIFFLLASSAFGAQSTITESDGYACMGEDRTKRQTEEVALQDAKKKAIEQVSTYIQSETQVKDFELQRDIVNAYANAKVKIIEQSGRWDSEPPKVGDCYRIKIKAEVIPDEEAMKRIVQSKAIEDPSAPLTVKVWTDKKEYRKGERIKIYIKGNKPFFAILLYKDASGKLLQLLPNPYRVDNYFNGGVIYEIPSGNDRFDLEVIPPFGEEHIILYTSTSKLGELDKEPEGAVYRVKTTEKGIGIATRGVAITQKDKPIPSEFAEERLIIKTR